MNNIIYEVIEHFKINHPNTDLIKWNKVTKSLEKIKTKKDLAIFLNKYLLPRLNDNFHSNFKIYDGKKLYTSTHKVEYRKSLFKKAYNKPEKYFNEKLDIKYLEQQNILYINAPRTWNVAYWNEYFTTLNTVLKKYKQYSGIIFDLSECLGGYYAPIIAPFHQIFGHTIIAHGINKSNNDNCFTHVLKKGKISDPDSWIKQINFNPNKLSDNKTSPVKIAVIISAYTGSAGEFATLFFKSRPGVKIFGEKSAGLATWQNVHQLESDKNSSLNIGLAFAIDRDGKVYDKKYYVEPDVKTAKPVTEAIKFISSKI